MMKSLRNSVVKIFPALTAKADRRLLLNDETRKKNTATSPVKNGGNKLPLMKHFL
jgi:hypothetical protein